MKGAIDLKPDEITFLNVLSACWHGGARARLMIVGEIGEERGFLAENRERKREIRV